MSTLRGCSHRARVHGATAVSFESREISLLLCLSVSLFHRERCRRLLRGDFLYNTQVGCALTFCRQGTRPYSTCHWLTMPPAVCNLRQNSFITSASFGQGKECPIPPHNSVKHNPRPTDKARGAFRHAASWGGRLYLNLGFSRFLARKTFQLYTLPDLYRGTMASPH